MPDHIPRPSWKDYEHELVSDWDAKGIPHMAGDYPFNDMVAVDVYEPKY